MDENELERQDWFGRLVLLKSAADEFATSSERITSWLRELYVAAKFAESPLLGEIRAIYKPANESAASELSALISRIGSIMGGVLVNTKHTRQKLGECRDWRSSIAAIQSGLRSAKPDCIAAWKAHLTATLKDIARDCAVIADDITDVQSTINDYEAITGRRRAELSTVLIMDVQALSRQSRETHINLEWLKRPQVLALLHKSYPGAKPEWVGELFMENQTCRGKLLRRALELRPEPSFGTSEESPNLATVLKELTKDISREVALLNKEIEDGRNLLASTETPDVPFAFKGQMNALCRILKNDDEATLNLYVKKRFLRDYRVPEAVILLKYAVTQHEGLRELSCSVELAFFDGKPWIGFATKA
jgi:hypothetical protein